jgi:fatty acid desaturase
VENAFYLQRAPLRHKRTERLATLAHFSLYCAALVLLLSPAQAIAFAAIHYALFGLFLGSVIATNHKGRPMLTERMAADFFVAQVVTSHNVRGGRLLDYWFGGLNYQIEHHLFPNMPRNMLPRAAPLVRKVCHAREVEYSEGPFIDTYSSLLRFLHNVVAKDIPDNAPGEAERITVD